MRKFIRKMSHVWVRLEGRKKVDQLLASSHRLIWNFFRSRWLRCGVHNMRGWMGHTLEHKTQFFRNVSIITCAVINKNVKLFSLFNHWQITIAIFVHFWKKKLLDLPARKFNYVSLAWSPDQKLYFSINFLTLLILCCSSFSFYDRKK